MGYSKFKKLQVVTKQFHLDAQTVMLFSDIVPYNPSSWLVETLKKSQVAPLTNEKSKSERIISPILMEIAEAYSDKVTLFSGEDLPVNAQEDLSGECDFFFVLHPNKPYIESPIISLVEAKKEDMEAGRAQCAAQMYAAKCYNDADGKDIPVIYGCATDGVEWQFMRFTNNMFYVDKQIYTDITQILGIWHYILQSY